MSAGDPGRAGLLDLLLAAVADGLHAEIDEVASACQAQRGERGRCGREERGQSSGSERDMDDLAGCDPCGGQQSGARAAAYSAAKDEQHVGSWADHRDKSGGEEDGKEV